MPLDRTRAAPLSEMAGIELKSAGVPAFVMHRGLKSLRPDEKGILKPSEWVAFRSGWELTGRSSDGANILVNSPPPSSKSGDTPGVYVETAIGLWLPLQSLRLGELGQDLWACVHGKRGHGRSSNDQRDSARHLFRTDQASDSHHGWKRSRCKCDRIARCSIRAVFPSELRPARRLLAR